MEQRQNSSVPDHPLLCREVSLPTYERRRLSHAIGLFFVVGIAGVMTMGMLRPSSCPTLSGIQSSQQLAWLGVRLSTQEDSNGAKVVSIFAGSPAVRAGITYGDVITQFDGIPVIGAEQLAAIVRGSLIGRDVRMLVRDKNGNIRKVAVVLGVRPKGL